jgi:UDP-N-acetylglucosamine:LPS N-acetylglucosamine transferase
LKVKYPLLPAPKPEETRTNETTNTEWERARQELYGVKEARNPWREQAEPFDEQRVETLKTQLIDDLVNAANIRNVKSDESIVVVVLGGGRGATGQEQYARAVADSRAVTVAGGRGGGTVSVKSSRSEGSGQTTMTLRAKKSDVDAFAKGKLKPEEFRKKVSVQVY